MLVIAQKIGILRSFAYRFRSSALQGEKFNELLLRDRISRRNGIFIW